MSVLRLIKRGNPVAWDHLHLNDHANQNFGNRLLEDEHYHYQYDLFGNLTEKVSQDKRHLHNRCIFYPDYKFNIHR